MGNKRTDLKPIAVASIWERSFSMLTINADGHPIMQHFHKPNDEKQSIVVLQENGYIAWLNANHNLARNLLNLAPNNFLLGEPSPR